ncbi:hypothetical protein A1O7_08298 [Cladophialophora yegresii CBS 114405]|uniref:Uncharacterized protein n=1 Tax=Cladophialophora yegresii CBS 114405 TaxID=1182544 RepID=W9VTA6_9EURO|nr:uncharacterized protein A1O7_08298 [Cladophialophora yegresii CBS 114405]EXJ55371.1 hypothetical protein A1O7_08298 [Cladophialophora yegresii CBS 114405]
MTNKSTSSGRENSNFFGFWQFFATMIASSYLKQTIITVLCVLGIPSYLSAPKPISVHLEGQSSISVPANRALVSLRIYAEGPKQDKVADSVRKTADDILFTLRPLVQVTPPNQNTTTTLGDSEPPIVDLSVTTFRSYSWLKPGSSILSREAPQYESSMEIEAEFRDFDVLGLLLAQVSKQPAVSVQRLKWTVDPVTKKHLFGRVRSEAMVDALDKVRAYVRPLGMDKVRAIKFSEDRVRSRDVVTADLGRVSYEYQHDEMDYDQMNHGTMKGEGVASEAFGLEPRTLEIVAQIDGEFCAWRTGLEAWFRRGGV